MQPEPEIIVLADAAAVQHEAAGRVAALAAARVEANRTFTLVLAGGSTPRGLYRRLAAEPLRSRIPWPAVRVLWGDERYVPYDDPESSYGMARETLLNHVPLPAEQIYPVPTYYADPAAAARIYDAQVRALLEDGGDLGLVLLGMGPDGHIASLFPHHPALRTPAGTLAVAVEGAPKLPPRRVTLTAEALNYAAHVLFLVTGADKAAAVRAALRGPAQPEELPARLVQPRHGSVTWLLDEAAAAELRPV